MAQEAEEQKILLGEIAGIPFQELYDALSRQRPDEIASLAQQLDHLPPGRPAEAKIKAFFTAWAHLDPSAAFDSAIGFHKPAMQSAAIGAIIAGADSEASGAIANSLNRIGADVLPGADRKILFNQALEKWSEADPAAAAKLLHDANLQGLRATSAFYTVAQNWAALDPEAALAWAQKQEDVPFGLNPVNGAVLGWWKKDPGAAEAYVLSQATTPEGKQLVYSIASRMALEDRMKARVWVEKLPDAELRHQAYGVLASQLAFADPKEAASWAQNLPLDAAPMAVGSVVSMWATSDPTAAGHWIESLTGETRDAAVSSYSYTVAETDPAAAMAWAITISDDAKRSSAEQRAASQWLERDPAAARAWIQNSSLGEAEKAKLLASPTPSP